MDTKHGRILFRLLGAALIAALTTEAQPTVTQIACGFYHNLFLKSDGSLWGMGDNEFGALGVTDSPSLMPEQIVTRPPPTLGITTYGNQAVVFFPLSVASNYVLQIKNSLTDSNWMTCTGQVPVIGLLITNTPGAFLRLH